MTSTPSAVQVAPLVLEGEAVRLEPLTTSHLDAFCAVGLDDELWRHSPSPIRSRDEFRTYIEAALEAQREGTALPFAIVERAEGIVVGSTRYGAIRPRHRSVEIGWTWVAQAWQRTAINTEAKLLLLRHAFERLGCERVELKTDRLNEQSRRAILRLGATEEGTLRRHMVTASGRLRDTVYFSIIRDEWPEVERRLQAKLARED